MSEVNKYIDFGSYPQSEVTDNKLINELNKLVTTLPTATDYGSWTSYDYYENGVVTPFMWYIDVTYNNELYRGVYFTNIRFTIINREGYDQSDISRIYPHIKLCNIYWYKYEPIKWRVLSDTEDEMLLITDLIVDFMEYYHSQNDRSINGKTIYANNWEYSNIREWLNNKFYNLAFNEKEKELILEKLINNKESFHSFSSKYFRSQNDTVDKVYLLSYHESSLYFSGSCLCDETKLTNPTKYAIINHMISGVRKDCDEWFLRTCGLMNSYMVNYVDEIGKIDDETFVDVVHGIRPVINISKK